MRTIIFVLSLVVVCTLVTQAQLAATVSLPKMVGQKTLVKLVMKNSFNEEIKSARAVCFLLDDQGKMVGQSAKWVIGGGEGKAGLAEDATNTFYFVFTTKSAFASSNLTAKVNFNQMTLKSGKMANVQQDVSIRVVPK